MALFRYLHDEIFSVLAGPNRKLFEECLVSLYARFFSASLSFPTQSEVIHELYETLRQNPDLWTDEEGAAELPDLLSRYQRRLRRLTRSTESSALTDIALQRARYIYNRLHRSGWLEEERYGLRITVDMPMGAMLLLEHLVKLRAGVSSRLGGVIVEIRTALRAVQEKASENALGLRQARENAQDFVRSLRATLSSLKQIRNDILASQSLEQRLATFFDDFIERLLLRDFENIHTKNHPYRHRAEILRLTRALSQDEITLKTIAKVYTDAGLVGSLEDGRLEAESDLLAVEQIFAQIGEIFDRINAFRRQLEAKLRSIVRYAERGRRGYGQRLRALIHKLDVQLELEGPDSAASLESLLEPVKSPWAKELQAEPRAPRQAVTPKVVQPRLNDPAFALYRQLRRDYYDRTNPPISRVLRFLERQVPPYGITEARWLKIESIDDFVAFDIVRRSAYLPDFTLEKHFEIKPLGPDSPRHESDWVRCENFAVRRLDDHITVER